jgi:hypothetical protein
MSQAKVDEYKKEKANRKKTLARNKVKHTCGVIAGWVILVAIVGWAGYSGYSYYEKSKPIETYVFDNTDLTNYLSSLDSEE